MSTKFGNGTVDTVYTTSSGLFMYSVDMDDSGSLILFYEDDLKLIPEKKEYSMDIKIDIAGNVLVATLYEVTDGDISKVIAKGHGHLLHDGEYGIAQAASYACKRLYEALGGFNK